jgi:Fe-S oxidoreductase
VSVDDDRTMCSYCPKLCRHECPTAIAEASEVATVPFKQQVAKLAAAGRLELDEETARVFYKCTGCLASRTPCRWEIDVETSLRDSRVLAVKAGKAPAEVEKVRRRFEERGHPYGRDLRKDLGDLVPAVLGGDARAPLALFASCTSIARYPEEIVDARVVLEATARLAASEPASGLAFAASDPPCCGYPLDALGLQDEFLAHARKVARSLEGHARIVTTGAACAWTLAVRYREIGVPLAGEVVPLVDELARRSDAVRILRRGRTVPGAPFAYHDPCYLGRHLRRYEEPRVALAAATGEPPRELDKNRASAYCSGAGGGYSLTHPEPARAVAGRALDAFRRTGARTLVTACPSARRIFEKTDPTVAAVSLVSVVADAVRSPAPR